MTEEVQDEMGRLYGPLEFNGETCRQMYFAYLGVSSMAECAEEEMYHIFPDGKEIEELWEIPKGVEILLEMRDVGWPPKYDENGVMVKRGFSVGYVIFGTYEGHEIVMEQNASPFLVLWKKDKHTSEKGYSI